MSFTQLDFRPRSAYVHVPFCKHRCGYCNFTLVAGRDDLVDAFLECLERELTNILEVPCEVDSLFIGGGTPTHLSLKQLERLLQLLQYWMPLASSGEYSCEANPLDCSSEKLRLLGRHGVNRLSLGGQSFNNLKLQRLERDHTGEQLEALIELACNHFDNVSLDLIFASPDETFEEWQVDIERALSSPIKHLSTYGLTIEPGASFWGRSLRGDIKVLDDDLQLLMYQFAIDRMTQAGWQHYEVSNFCKPGMSCRHNQTYWQGRPWWAFGPGASSFLARDLAFDGSSVDIDHRLSNEIRSRSIAWVRATNHRSTTQYIKLIRAGKSPIHECDVLSLEQLIRERLVFGLRQIEGIAMAELAHQWPGSLDELFEPYLARYLEQGWLELVDHRLRLTRAGLMISDSLWPDLLA